MLLCPLDLVTALGGVAGGEDAEVQGGEAGGGIFSESEGASHKVSNQLGIESLASSDTCCSLSFSNTGLYLTMSTGV